MLIFISVCFFDKCGVLLASFFISNSSSSRDTYFGSDLTGFGVVVVGVCVEVDEFF